MRKFFVLTLVVALFIGIPFCVFAQEEPRDASRLCKAAEFAIADYVNDLGQCVRYIQACTKESGHSPDWCACVLIRAVDPTYEIRFGKGLGPCIEFVRANPSYY
jgi:hypothetical protein